MVKGGVLDRREFIAGLSATGIAAGIPHGALAQCRLSKRPKGPLIADPAGIVDLPAGFGYRVLQRTGDAMSDGYRVPAAPDGMGCFVDEYGRYVVLRNHELTTDFSTGAYNYDAVPSEAFDSSVVGGVTRLVVDPNTLKVVESQLVLTGTHLNCSGGVTSGGWISCEESEMDGHGWAFLVSPTASRLTEPQPVRSWGRFRRESVVMDAKTSTTYMTEDDNRGCFYRFVPESSLKPYRSGKLQALSVAV